MWRTEFVQSVLILVVVEDGLRGQRYSQAYKSLKNVLILVVVEDGLRGKWKWKHGNDKRPVLILVVVEDGLRESHEQERCHHDGS